MKFKSLFFAVLAATFSFVSCENEKENLGTPSISISASEMKFEVAGGNQTLTIKATRDWKVEGLPSDGWVAVSPEKGEASSADQTVTVTALANDGSKRSAEIKFSIGTFSKTLKVSQAGESFVMPPVPDGYASIEAILKSTGTIAEGSKIRGIVISNMALNNLTSKKGLYVQDATGGLQFYLGANHDFAFGDMVDIDLSGVSLGEYGGAVQISGLDLSKITKISSGNAIEAKTVAMADFLANKYEGQYVALEGVQVKSSDLSKTWVVNNEHTSIAFEDVNGNSFVVFSSKYADDNSGYGTQAVAQGSGTVKGISSINNGKMQLIFTQESDFAELTGERFTATGSGEVTPPAGGEGEGDEEDGGEVTPPTGPITANAADFNGLAANSNYVTSTTPNGWVLTNCAIQMYGTASNKYEQQPFLPEGVKAACINGKTAAVGTIQSPVIVGGCGTLSFSYAAGFSESNGISFKVEVFQDDAVVKAFDVVKTDSVIDTVYDHEEDINVTGNFSLKFTNNSPSNNSEKNKDRYSIWNITWTSKAE